MKTMGLIGGMSWESTIPYYRIVNETIKERLGGLHSAKLILYSVDFHEMRRNGRLTIVKQVARMQAEGRNPGIKGGTRIALRQVGASFLQPGAIGGDLYGAYQQSVAMSP